MGGRATKLTMMVLFIVLGIAQIQQTSAQTCKGQSLTSNKVYRSCSDLPYLTSYLHWSYDQSTGKLDIAFRHAGISSNNRWVAWAINKNNNLKNSMIGAQAIVAVPGSSGASRAYTSSVDSTSTTLAEGNISYPSTGLSATHQGSEVTIYATLTLPKGTSSVVHVWQDGPISGSTPSIHDMGTSNIASKQTLNLLSGVSQGGSTGNSLRRRRNVHGVLNALSWGILMPIGAIIARYVKVFEAADPAWFYLHVTCQTSAYIIGVAGWGTGLKLGSDTPGVTYHTHRTLGIILFCLGTLQVFALLLRPSKDHKFRLYWNIYHHSIGYGTIAISIVNIFKGFDAMKNSVGDRYDNWKHAYIGIIVGLGGLALLLEAFTWIVVMKRKKSQNKMSHGMNGTNGGFNGYGSRPQQA